jgi:hypothetical protein
VLAEGKKYVLSSHTSPGLDAIIPQIHMLYYCYVFNKEET